VVLPGTATVRLSRAFRWTNRVGYSASPPVPRPVWGWLGLPSLADLPVVSHGFGTPSSCLSRRMHLEVFPTGPGRGVSCEPPCLLAWPFAPLAGVTRIAPPGCPWLPEGCRGKRGLLSWGFFPFSALAMGSDSCRAYLTRLRSARRFTRPLSALLPPWPSRPCFMPLALLGLCPPEPSLDERPWCLSTPAPLLTLPPGSGPARHGKPRATGPSPLDRLQGFPPPASPFRLSARLIVDRRRCSPGLLPSKGLPWLAMGAPSRSLLSRTSGIGWRGDKAASPFARCPRVSLLESCGWSLARLPSFLGSLPFSLLTSLWSALRPWLIVSPQGAVGVTATGPPFFGPHPLRPE